MRAVIVSVCLLSTAAALGRAAGTEPVSVPVALSELPLAFDAWKGVRAAGFDARTMDLLGVDEYINRVYFESPRTPVSLYVGFYRSQREGDTIHSPLNCLPGSGWQPVEQSRLTLPWINAGGSPVTINRLMVEKGEERLLVLYWYQSHGEVIASEYWNKVSAVLNTIRYNRSDAALVRITVPVGGDPQGAADQAMRFTTAVFPRLKSYLPS